MLAGQPGGSAGGGKMQRQILSLSLPGKHVTLLGLQPKSVYGIAGLHRHRH